jgi:hypothetical protein
MMEVNDWHEVRTKHKRFYRCFVVLVSSHRLIEEKKILFLFLSKEKSNDTPTYKLIIIDLTCIDIVQ